MKIRQHLLKRGVLTLGLSSAAAILLLGFSPNVSAQWTSPSPNPNNNIYYNSGNVGIGTTTPNEILEISATNPSLRATMTGTTGYAAVRLYSQANEKARYAWNSDIGTYVFDKSGLGTNFLASSGAMF